MHLSRFTLHFHPCRTTHSRLLRCPGAPSWCLLFAILLSPLVSPASARYFRVQGPEFVRPDGTCFRIKGTNLGNWLVPEGYLLRLEGGPESPRELETAFEALLGPDRAARFWQEYRDRFITREDIRFLAQIGCNTLRVPLHWRLFREGEQEGLRRLDGLVDWCREFGLALILDMHCAPGGQTGTNIDDSFGYPWLFESESAQATLIQVWGRIARHYSREPLILCYDLLNEPLPGYPEWSELKPKLEPLFKRLVAAVREVDVNHAITLTGANWDSDFSVLGKPFAPNIAYTFHKYWVPPDEKAVRDYVAFREKYQVPIWLGESGENTDAWVAQFRQLLDSKGIGWTFWPYKKMQRQSGFVRFAMPRHWRKIADFVRQPPWTSSKAVQGKLPARPTAMEIDEAFTDLLENIRFERCESNAGYLQALGLGRQ